VVVCVVCVVLVTAPDKNSVAARIDSVVLDDVQVECDMLVKLRASTCSCCCSSCCSGGGEGRSFGFVLLLLLLLLLLLSFVEFIVERQDLSSERDVLELNIARTTRRVKSHESLENSRLSKSGNLFYYWLFIMVLIDCRTTNEFTVYD
jgi:hypothetical protein